MVLLGYLFNHFSYTSGWDASAFVDKPRLFIIAKLPNGVSIYAIRVQFDDIGFGEEKGDYQ